MSNELPLYTFHLNAFEIGILIGILMKENIKIRKELSAEIDELFYKQLTKEAPKA